jgi:hypothetical protein
MKLLVNLFLVYYLILLYNYFIFDNNIQTVLLFSNFININKNYSIILFFSFIRYYF